MIKIIDQRAKEFEEFERVLRERLGRTVEDFGIDLQNSKTIVLGCYSRDGGLSGFGIFQPYFEPLLHFGSMIEPSVISGTMAVFGDVLLYNISLVYSLEGDDKLADITRRMIRQMEKLLLQRADKYCLLISLFKKANRRAFRFYKSMGFKRRGASSYYMDIRPEDVVKRYGKVTTPIGSIVLKSFEKMDDSEFESLCDCYVEVFMGGETGEFDVKGSLKRVISKPSFSKKLSTVVCDSREEGKVVGFCFIEEAGDDSFYINAAGLRSSYRGKGISMKSFSWIMERGLRHGYRKATLITGSLKLRLFFSRAICAVYRDTLVWMVKCGIRNDSV